MKLKITFLFIGLLSMVSFSQVEGPPPPCGINADHACDGNGDGFEVFNLVEAFPFSSFCKSFEENEEPKCWLQISGWYDLGKHTNQENDLPF